MGYRQTIRTGALALGLIGSMLVGSSRAQVTEPRTITDTNADHRDYGWLGLLGLVGLAGLVRNRKEDRSAMTRSAAAAR